MKYLMFTLSSGLFASAVMAGPHGNIDSASVEDSAIVCMSVGLQASVAGLDDLALQVVEGGDGGAGAIYIQEDEFVLEANGAVRLLASSQPLTFNDHEISVQYLLDGNPYTLETLNDAVHNDQHTLKAVAQLGNISSQLAGSYSTSLFLTVVPALGGDDGCGQQTYSRPIEQSEWAFVAFEDLYPNPGDADYNDFVMAFQSNEAYNASGELETINMSYIPVARGAGYNHSAHLDLDGELQRTRNVTTITDPLYEGEAIVKATYTNMENGNQIERYFAKDKDVTLFANTRAALAGMANVYEGQDVVEPLWRTDLEITLQNPELNLISDRGQIGDDSYRIYLNVKNTNKDIDLYTVNPNDGMIDRNGYPFGIVVPADWQWPLERTHIDEAYPHFESYRAWLAGESTELSFEAEHWYLSPTTADGVVVDKESIQEITESADLD